MTTASRIVATPNARHSELTRLPARKRIISPNGWSISTHGDHLMSYLRFVEAKVFDTIGLLR